MHVSRLIIEKFRSVKSASIILRPGKNIIIGKNNAGKSNISRALEILFGDKWPTGNDITENDYYFDRNAETRSEDFIISARIEGDDIDIDKLRSVRGLFAYSLEATERFADSTEEGVAIRGDFVFDDFEHRRGFEKFPSSGSKTYCKNGSKNFDSFIEELVTAQQYYFVFRSQFDKDTGSSRGEIRFMFLDKDNGVHLCWGFDNRFRESFINSAIMPANRDAYNQTKISNWTWYGKLLKRVWESKKDDPEIKTAMDLAVSSVISAGKPVYSELADDVNKKIRFGFQGASVSFPFLGQSKVDMHKQVQIYVDDGISDSINRKGLGIQSAVVIGLFAYYCSYSHNTSVLVVEEPEVFLHPQARRSISRRLDEFVNQGSDRGKFNQVIVTTHSVEMIQVGDVATISLICKGDSGTLAKTIDLSGDGFLEREIKGFIRGSASDMLFADRVILSEGAEQFIFPRLYDDSSEEYGRFDEDNLSSVSVGGKGGFYSYSSALKLLDIPYVIITDFDFLDKTVLSYIRNGDPGHILLPKIVELHRLLNLRPGGMMSFLAKSGLSSLNDEERPIAEEIMDALKAEFSIWVLRNGRIEDYMTVKGRGELTGERKGKLADYRIASVCRDKDKPLREYLNLDELQEMIDYFGLFNKIDA